jgi:hypothetical protein
MTDLAGELAAVFASWRHREVVKGSAMHRTRSRKARSKNTGVKISIQGESYL